MFASLGARFARRTRLQFLFLDTSFPLGRGDMPTPIHTTVTAMAVSWMRPLTAMNFPGAAFGPHGNMAGETDVRRCWP
jgi:hypothetical protein